MATHPVITIARFWSKVEVRSRRQCWPWRGRTNQKGYGIFSEEGAHRVAYRLWNEEEPGGSFVCHHCDNPACCNPDHLYLGDAATNNSDCRSRGRHKYPVGDKHGQAKLSNEQVAEIRSSKAKGVDLARKYGVAQSTISEIRSYRWRRAG